MKKICYMCLGEKKIEVLCDFCNGSGEGMTEYTTCSHCQGNGGWLEICDFCNGSGIVNDDDNNDSEFIFV